MNPPAKSSVDKNNPREVFGWMMYDWANSAFSTTVVGVIFGKYLTALAQGVVGENGTVLSLGSLGAITAKSLYPICAGISVFGQVFLLPIIGSIADYSNLKKRLMAIFCYLGAGLTCLMFFLNSSIYLIGGLLFILANLSFGAAVVVYNAFLPEITSEDQRDKVSSRGFALGYLGGGLLLAGNLLLLKSAPQLGLSSDLAARISLLSAGIWWGGFSIITFKLLKPRPSRRTMPAGKTYLTIGFSELRSTMRVLLKLRHTLRYLIGYLLFNDGIQTVILMAGVFIDQELFRPRGVNSDSFLFGLFLMVQFVAFGGAILFERIAAFIGTKNAIMVSLILWSGIVIYAYGFLQTTTQAWLMGALIGIVLGGSQALSRSLFSRMIPEGREASFFGIYEISERGTSWMGPIVFGLIVSATNSYRQAILSLIFFFIAGLVILFFTNTDRAVHEAGNALPEEV